VLIQQLAEANTPSASEVALTSSSAQKEERGDRENERIQGLESKVKLLEKDLFYYKKTSRELKKRLQQFQSQASDSGSSVIKLREEGGGGREGKSKSARGSSTERGHDVIMSRDGVTDSLEVGTIVHADDDKNLIVSGTSLTKAGTKAQQRHTTTSSTHTSSAELAAVARSVIDRVEQAPPIAPPTGEAQQQQQQVVRKQKKQLRLLR
jgi:hypothetical protein